MSIIKGITNATISRINHVGPLYLVVNGSENCPRFEQELKILFKEYNFEFSYNTYSRTQETLVIGFSHSWVPTKKDVKKLKTAVTKFFEEHSVKNFAFHDNDPRESYFTSANVIENQDHESLNEEKQEETPQEQLQQEPQVISHIHTEEENHVGIFHENHTKDSKLVVDGSNQKIITKEHFSFGFHF